MPFTLDPFNPGGFLEDLGAASTKKPKILVDSRKRESRKASSWQVWVPTGHRVQDVLVPLRGDLTDISSSTTGQPDVRLIADSALQDMFYVANVTRDPVVGRLTISVPEQTGALLERVLAQSGPIPVQRHNRCGSELLQIEHYDQVYFGPVQGSNLTAQGPQTRDAVPMVSYSGVYSKRTTLEMGGPELYIYRVDNDIEYSITALRYGSNVSNNPEPCSVLWLLLDRIIGSPQRSFLYRSTNSRYYRDGAPYIIGGQFELIWADEVDNRKWRQLFEHRGRVWLLGDKSGAYNGLSVIDDLLESPDPDTRIELVDVPTDATLSWYDMAANGYPHNVLYALYHYDLVDVVNGYGDGVAKSTDHGITWTGVHSTPGNIATEYRCLCAAGNFVAIGSQIQFAQARVQYSNDSGNTWTTRNTVLDKIFDITAILPDQNDPDNALVYIIGVLNDVLTILRTNSQLVEQIIIYEKSFVGVGGIISARIEANLSGCQIWANATEVNLNQHHMFRSEDRGTTWKPSIIGSGEVSAILRLAVCPENPDHAAAGY